MVRILIECTVHSLGFILLFIANYNNFQLEISLILSVIKNSRSTTKIKPNPKKEQRAKDKINQLSIMNVEFISKDLTLEVLNTKSSK